MKIRQVISTLIYSLFFTVAVVAQPPCTMPATRSWIHLTETTGVDWDTLWFGFDTAASYGIDPDLCEEEIFQSPEFPFRFVDLPDSTLMGYGIEKDFRAFTSISQVDTHLISFGVSWPTEYTLRWSPSGIQQICDSAVLADVFGFNRLRLDLTDSVYQVPDPLLSFYLIRYGAKSTTVDVREGRHKPHTFRLFQNHPNPFNPTTEIRYELAERGFVILDVVDVLGRVVATLIRRVDAPGIRTISFDASGLGGGFYFVRLNVDGSMATRKMVLLR